MLYYMYMSTLFVSVNFVLAEWLGKLREVTVHIVTIFHHLHEPLELRVNL